MAVYLALMLVYTASIYYAMRSLISASFDVLRASATLIS